MLPAYFRRPDEKHPSYLELHPKIYLFHDLLDQAKGRRQKNKRHIRQNNSQYDLKRRIKYCSVNQTNTKYFQNKYQSDINHPKKRESYMIFLYTFVLFY